MVSFVKDMVEIILGIESIGTLIFTMVCKILDKSYKDI